MRINDVASALSWPRDQVKLAISVGVALPISKDVVRLSALHLDDGDYDISDGDLDSFLQRFESEEPGRHPPAEVRRTLLTEARHKCGVCRDVAPLQFHHVVEFSDLKHHDPSHMLAVCGTCHSRITIGEIDSKSQRLYKQRLRDIARELAQSKLVPGEGPLRFNWEDLRAVVLALSSELSKVTAGEGSSRYDFSHVEVSRKNELNRLTPDYYEVIRVQYELHFQRIDEFLKDPVNRSVTEAYHEAVDDLRSNAVHLAGFL